MSSISFFSIDFMKSPSHTHVALHFKSQFQAAQRGTLRAVACVNVFEEPDEALKGALVYGLTNSHLISARESM